MTYKEQLIEHYKQVRKRLGMGVQPKKVPLLLAAPSTIGGVSGGTGVAPPGAVEHSDKVREYPQLVAAREAQAVINAAAIEAETSVMPKLPPLPEGTITDPLSQWRQIGIAVARRNGLKFDDLMGRKRARDVVNARFELMYRMRTELRMSYPDIANRLGRDHSSVIHAVRVIKSRLLDEIREREQSGGCFTPADMVSVDLRHKPTRAIVTAA